MYCCLLCVVGCAMPVDGCRVLLPVACVLWWFVLCRCRSVCLLLLRRGSESKSKQMSSRPVGGKACCGNAAGLTFWTRTTLNLAEGLHPLLDPLPFSGALIPKLIRHVEAEACRSCGVFSIVFQLDEDRVNFL